jgi:hypothetical protein
MPAVTHVVTLACGRLPVVYGDSLGTAVRCGLGCAAGHQVAPLSMVHGFWVY